jgi:hypothetical protein
VAESPVAKNVDAMGPVHHIVLYCAVDGGPLIDPLHGAAQVIYNGESFVLFAAQPLDAVREATIDVVRAGFAVLHSAPPDERREFTLPEAVEILARDSTWTVDHYYELASTAAGERAFQTLHERHGDEYRRATAEASRRSEEFLQRHPEHPAKQAEYFEALRRWVDTGEGPKPEPRYAGEPRPYGGDVPRHVRSEKPDDQP